MQDKYQPRSSHPGLKTLKTLIPANLATATQQGLNRIEKDTGNFIDYLCECLNYTPEELCQYFAAEQLDGLAAAIWNLKREKMLIIGDQTGIGKGRQAAGVIRYGLENNIPVLFITAKANLLADLKRDLRDIGMPDVEILATTEVKSQDLRPGRNYSVVFTTYSQCSTVRGKQVNRHAFLRNFAEQAIIVADEVHEAGTGVDPEEMSSRGRFIRELFTLGQGIVCLSATAFKTPEQVALYSRTDMTTLFGHEAQGQAKLVRALQTGGIPLQQALCIELAAAGQYLRRERDLSALKFEIHEMPIPVKTVNRISQIKSDILAFDQGKQFVLEDNKDYFKNLITDGSIGEEGITSTLFTSIAHNLLAVEILAYKCEPAIEHFVKAIQSGQKIVIGIENTNESLLQRYAEEQGLKPGDFCGITFAQTLKRYLDRSREIMIGKAYSHKQVHRLTDKELGKYLTEKYEKILADIESLSLEDHIIPASPIDWIKYRLSQHGIKVGEITGRGLILDYETSTLQMRSTIDRSKKMVNQICAEFNNGDLDALIVSRTGPVGISLHASETFKNQKQRKLFILQPFSDIANFIQLLGRVDRTGQVVTPEYCLLSSELPSERRPNGMLMRKLALLNASVVATKEGTGLDFSAIPDFIGNELSDWVASSVLNEFDEINQLLGYPLEKAETLTLELGDKNLEYYENAMRRATGRIHLISSLEKQEEIFNLLQDRYLRKVQELELSGSSLLSAKNLDLKAIPVAYCEIPVVSHESDNPFEKPIRVELQNCISPFKPIPPDKLYQILLNKLKITATNKVEQAGKLHSERTIQKLERQVRRHFKLSKEAEIFEPKFRLTRKILSTFPIGQPVKLTSTLNPIYGIVIGFQQTSDAKNPAALSNWRLEIAIANGSTKRMSFFFSELLNPNSEIVNLIPCSNTEDGTPILNLFELYQKEFREDRYFVTSNLLAAYRNNFRGEIICYSQKSGNNQVGTRLNRNFNPSAYQANSEAILVNKELFIFLTSTFNGVAHIFKDDAEQGTLRLDRYGNQYLLETKSNQLIFDSKFKDITGKDFVSVNNLMRMYVSKEQLSDLFNYFRQQRLAVVSLEYQKEILQHLGIPSELVFTPIQEKEHEAVKS